MLRRCTVFSSGWTLQGRRSGLAGDGVPRRCCRSWSTIPRSSWTSTLVGHATASSRPPGSTRLRSYARPARSRCSATATRSGSRYGRAGRRVARRYRPTCMARSTRLVGAALRHLWDLQGNSSARQTRVLALLGTDKGDRAVRAKATRQVGVPDPSWRAEHERRQAATPASLGQGFAAEAIARGRETLELGAAVAHVATSNDSAERHQAIPADLA